MIKTIKGLFNKKSLGTASHDTFAGYIPDLYSIISSSGISISEEDASKNPIVSACINKKASLIGQLQFKLYKSGEELDKSNFQYRQLENPNGLQTMQSLLEMMVSNHDLYGSFYGAVERISTGKVLNIIPASSMPSFTVDKYADPIFRLSGYKHFKIEPNTNRTTDEVIRIISAKNDGVRGVSLLKHCLNEVLLFESASMLAQSKFKNNSSPSGFLTTDQVLTQEAAGRLLKSWNAAHQGVQRAGKTAVLEQGIKFERMGESNKDSQLVEIQNHSAISICNSLGVPPQLLGLSDGNTFSHDELMRGFYKDTLYPLIKKIEDAFNNILPEEFEFKLDTSNLLKGDEKALAETVNMLVINRILTTNEAREKLGYAPVDGGDILPDSTSTVRVSQNESSEV